MGGVRLRPERAAARPEGPLTTRMTRDEVGALLADKDRALKRAQRARRKDPEDAALAAAVEAAREEKRLVTFQHQIMAKGWVLSCPQAHIDAMRPPTRDAYVQLLSAVALVSLFSVEVFVDEIASVGLTVRAAKEGIPTSIPGIFDAAAMRYPDRTAFASAPTPQEALALAMADILSELSSA